MILATLQVDHTLIAVGLFNQDPLVLTQHLHPRDRLAWPAPVRRAPTSNVNELPIDNSCEGLDEEGDRLNTRGIVVLASRYADLRAFYRISLLHEVGLIPYTINTRCVNAHIYCTKDETYSDLLEQKVLKSPEVSDLGLNKINHSRNGHATFYTRLIDHNACFSYPSRMKVWRVKHVALFAASFGCLTVWSTSFSLPLHRVISSTFKTTVMSKAAFPFRSQEILSIY